MTISKIKQLTVKIISNKVIIYVMTRYMTYFLQFINSLIIAVKLGPYYLGIYGFLNLAIQYFEKVNFGISDSFNAMASIHKEDKKYVSELFGVAFTNLLVIAVAAVSLLVMNSIFHWELGEKFNFSKYSGIVAAIIVLYYFNPLFLHLFRIHGRTTEIVINQSLIPVISLVVLVFTNTQEAVLYGIMWAILLSLTISAVFFLARSPIRIKPAINFSVSRRMMTKGFYLFLYSMSFYFILITSRSFISSQYSVREFGYFTFSFSLANVVLLLFQSVSFLIFPKIINRLAYLDDKEGYELLIKLKTDYVTISHLTSYIVIFLFPIFIYLFPDYQESEKVFNLTLLTMVLYTNCFGYQGLLIAKEKERVLSLISISSLILNIGILFLLTVVLHVHFAYVVLGTMCSYSFFLILLTFYGNHSLNVKFNGLKLLEQAFPIRLFIPFLVTIVFVLMNLYFIYYIVSIIIFILLNYRELIQLYDSLKRIINKPSVVDI